MNCVDLATTGQPLDVVLVAGLCCLLVGLTLLLLVRTPRGRTVVSTVLMMLVLCAVPLLVEGGSPSASAGGADCVAPSPAAPGPAAPSPAAPGPAAPVGPITRSPDPARSRLVIRQISTLAGLVPGADPKPIIGSIANDGPVEVYVADVTVSIVSVSKAFDAAAGACDPSDYRLQGVRMPVGLTIRPGGSTLFSGASIRFENKPSTNQDACQGAVINLRYVST